SFFDAVTRTVIYTLSLHDALPISCMRRTKGETNRANTAKAETGLPGRHTMGLPCAWARATGLPGFILTRHRSSSPPAFSMAGLRSEEHTSELQSRENLVCRLLLEK